MSTKRLRNFFFSCRFLLLILSLILLHPFEGNAQTADNVPELLDSVVNTDPVPDKLLKPKKKRFGRAALLFGISELGIWGFDRYVTQVDWAKITWKTTKNNINPAHWQFDNDPFTTNQFGHPYHGSLFFNSFRSNGYSFYESAAATAVGSYLWETFAETQAPSPNDFVNTTFGGIVLGEMTHRISNKIINNERTGFKRQVSEVIAFIINPTNGLNRIMDGKWGKYGRNTIEHDSTKISAEFDIGLRQFGTGDVNLLKEGKFGWFARAKFLYGTRYEDYKTPFSNIYIAGEFGQDDSTYLNTINVYGSLTGWEVKSTEKLQSLAIISANYDFIRNEAFFYGGQSVRFNLFSDYKLSNKIRMSSIFGAGPVLLAAVPSNYMYRERNYAYGSGATVAAGGSISISDKFFYSLDYRGAWIRTINGYDSYYFLHTLTSEFRYALNKTLSIAAEPGYFNLYGHYKYLNDVQRHYPYLRLSARYTVGL
ncbi:MAG: DUF3943 domain-containing protein [Sphingobacteriaceae bacterium]|nr:MAG: DUF3943 domain-containing protein [Sphingobacteriaceae bacterium]